MKCLLIIEFMEKNMMENNIEKDIENLYNAFKQLCDCIETSSMGCENCTRNSVCFSKQGIEFAESLKRIQTYIEAKGVN